MSDEQRGEQEDKRRSGWLGSISDTVTFTKQVSEADMALFALITRADDFVATDPPPPVRQPRLPAPYALLAALLAAAVLRHGGEEASMQSMQITQQQMTFLTPLYTDDTAHIIATVTAFNEDKRSLSISAECRNQEQVLLAHAEFVLQLS